MTPTLSQTQPLARVELTAAMENPDWVYDWAFEHFTGKLGERIAAGLAGALDQPVRRRAGTRFAGALRRPPRAAARLGTRLGAQRLPQWACRGKAKAGFFPILVTGNGGGPERQLLGGLRGAGQSQGHRRSSCSAHLAAYPPRGQGPLPRGWIHAARPCYDDSASHRRRPPSGTATRRAWAGTRSPGLSHEEFEDLFQGAAPSLGPAGVRDGLDPGPTPR